MPSDPLQVDHYLSSRVESLRAIRRRSRQDEKINLIERWQRLLHAAHSFQACILIFLIAAILPIIFSLMMPIRANPISSSATMPAIDSTLCSALIGVAGALASISGFLSAAIVLALQLQAQNLGQAAFLLRYMVRREGLLPLSAFFLAVMFANITVVLLIPQCSYGMMIADVFCLCHFFCY
jgi:hypothetical protein